MLTPNSVNATYSIPAIILHSELGIPKRSGISLIEKANNCAITKITIENRIPIIAWSVESCFFDFVIFPITYIFLSIFTKYAVKK